MISVTFDSNVWEQIVDEEKRVQSTTSQYIFNKIKSGEIAPFFFEGLAILENIPKKDRKTYFGNFRASISFQVGDEDPQLYEGTIPDKLTEYLQESIPKALELGFRFIHTPRIGAPSLSLPERYRAKDEKYNLPDRLSRTFDCLNFIEGLGAGKARIHSRLDGNGDNGIVHQTKNDNNLSTKQYAKDISEWADGDALAAHYGFGIDYFCTNDQAKGAGTSSVFNAKNLSALNEKYNIQVLNPTQLAEMLKQKPQNDI